MRGIFDPGAATRRQGTRTFQCLDCERPDPLKTTMRFAGFLVASYGRRSKTRAMGKKQPAPTTNRKTSPRAPNRPGKSSRKLRNELVAHRSHKETAPGAGLVAPGLLERCSPRTPVHWITVAGFRAVQLCSFRRGLPSGPDFGNASGFWHTGSRIASLFCELSETFRHDRSNLCRIAALHFMKGSWR